MTNRSVMTDTSKEAMKLALEALELCKGAETVEGVVVYTDKEITALREALAQERSSDEQPAQDNTYGYAKYLAEAMFKRHFASDEHYASGRVVWGVNDTVIGILTQIDNMVADMVRKPAQQEQQIAEALRRHGLTLIKTERGYDVMNLRQITAHGITGEQK